MNPFSIFACSQLGQLMDSGADESTLLMQTAKLQVQPALF
jgi:hypothetical protein